MIASWAAIRAWDKVGEQEKKIMMSFTIIMQNSWETFTDFVHWSMSTINKVIPDSDVKQVLIEVLAFENSNAECKKSLDP